MNWTSKYSRPISTDIIQHNKPDPAPVYYKQKLEKHIKNDSCKNIYIYARKFMFMQDDSS